MTLAIPFIAHAGQAFASKLSANLRTLERSARYRQKRYREIAMNAALQILVVVTLIGVIAGLVFNRYGRTWFGRTRAGDLTAALIGIAGAFLADYLVAIVGALVTLWAWRDR